MDLNTLWFVLVAVLFAGFFFLEGFDYGVGILLPFVAKTDHERRQVINTIGPHWDGNEVWLITAGGALFAAFPNWYATLFSGFYLPLFLILVALILRGVAFEFRSKDDNPVWRRTWDYAIFFGSLLPAILWGVAFGNIVRGVPIDENMIYTGGFVYLLNPYALLTGVATLLLFVFHGGLFLMLKTEGSVYDRVRGWMLIGGVGSLVAVVGLALWSFDQTTLFSAGFNFAWVGLAVSGIALPLALIFALIKRYGLAFIGTGLSLIFVVFMFFGGIFPNVMPSTLGHHLTIYNASSTPYTLKIMTFIALTFVPIVLGYQGWTYWVFRQRVTADSHLEY